MKGRYLGVDLGATWLRAALADENGRLLRRWRLPAVRWPAAAKSIRRLRLGRLDRLTIGPTGVWKPSERRDLARSLSGLAREVRVLSDVELAHEAAFDGGPGILVIAGTGSIAFGKNSKGQTRRAGGLGALLGDEGSGFWLGREALRRPALKKFYPETLALRLAHDVRPIRAIAALAPGIMRLARHNTAARSIVIGGATQLASRALALSRSLGLKRNIPVVLHGSLFRDRLFHDACLRRLGSRFVCRKTLTAPDVAAARRR